MEGRELKKYSGGGEKWNVEYWFCYRTSIVEYSRGGSIAEECQESIVEGGRDVLVRKMTRRRQQPRLLHSGAS